MDVQKFGEFLPQKALKKRVSMSWAQVWPADIALYCSVANVTLERVGIWEGDVTACTVQLQGTSIPQSVQLLDYRVNDHRTGVQLSAGTLDCSVEQSSDWLRCRCKAGRESSLSDCHIVLVLILH